MGDRGADTFDLPVVAADPTVVWPGPPPVPTVAPPSPPPVGPPPPGWRQVNRRLVLVVLAVALLALVPIGYQTFHDGAQAGAWGGFKNGRIPTDRLCVVPGQPDHRLRCDAAEAYGRMTIAYRVRFKTKLCITDSYRDYDAQVAAHQAKPNQTAVPGTSNHGWGLAVDLGCGINRFGTPQHRWMLANGGTYGWVHPAWAAKGQPRAEPWHFEFGSIS